MAYVEVAVRVLVAAVFAVAVAGKLARRSAWREFVASVRGFDVLPPAAVRPAAAAVVLAEAAVVALLAVARTVPLGYGLAAGLLALFTAAMVRALRRGVQPVCRCFGARGSAIGRVHVGRNVALAATAVAALLGRLDGGGVHPAGAAVAAAAGLLTAAVVLRLDDLAALFAPAPTRRPR